MAHTQLQPPTFNDCITNPCLAYWLSGFCKTYASLLAGLDVHGRKCWDLVFLKHGEENDEEVDRIFNLMWPGQNLRTDSNLVTRKASALIYRQPVEYFCNRLAIWMYEIQFKSCSNKSSRSIANGCALYFASNNGTNLTPNYLAVPSCFDPINNLY